MTARAVVSTFSAGRAPSQLAGWWLGAAIILAYANAVTLPFVFDDVSATVNNPTIRSLHEAWSAPPAGTSTVNRPVANLTLALNHVISGDAPWSYHATNVLLHALAALTLAGLVRRTLLLPGCGGRYNARSAAHIGACAALLWSVHPLLTAAVTPVAQRTEVLCGWLYLGVFYGFVRGLEQRQPWRWWAPAVGACALGMGAKEVMVTAPLLLLWFDRVFVSGSLAQTWRERGRLHLLMVATWLPLAWILWRAGGARGAAAGFGLGVEWWQYALKQCEAVVHYLRLAVLPWPLVYDYGTGVRYHLAEVWWQAGLLAGLAGMVLWAAARRPVAGFPGLWFLAVLAPSSSVVPLVTQTMAEHRMYLPLAGLMVLGAGWLHQRLGARLWLVAGPLAVLAIGATAVRNADYRSEERLWRDTAAKAPENSRAHYNLGAALLDAGDIAGAIDALERARALAPDDPGVLNNLANALLGAGRSAEAREHLRHAIALRPAFAPFHLNLGHTWVAERRWPEARAAYEAALRLDPGLAAAQANLGAVLLQLGDWEAARTASRAALGLDPNLTVARRNLGLALLQLRRPAEAVAELLRAHEAEPGELATLRALAVAHGLLGQRAEALRWAQAGLRVSPADPALQELLRQLAVDRP